MTSRKALLLALLGFLTAGLLASWILSLAGGRGITGDEADALAGYRDAIKPFQREAGRIVVEDIRPALSALAAGDIDGEQFREVARGWLRDLTSIRESIDVVPVPERLQPVAAKLDDAFEGYLDAIREFMAASYRPVDELAEAFDEPAAIAESADRIYDAAGQMLERILREAGVDPEG